MEQFIHYLFKKLVNIGFKCDIVLIGVIKLLSRICVHIQGIDMENGTIKHGTYLIRHICLTTIRRNIVITPDINIRRAAGCSADYNWSCSILVTVPWLQQHGYSRQDHDRLQSRWLLTGSNTENLTACSLWKMLDCLHTNDPWCWIRLGSILSTNPFTAVKITMPCFGFSKIIFFLLNKFSMLHRNLHVAITEQTIWNAKTTHSN